MPQVKRNKTLAVQIGRRLKILVELHLEGSCAEIARQLGYRTSTTLRRAQRGEVTLSAEKLSHLARVVVQGNRRVSIHWLLTGEGSPLVKLKDWRVAADITPLCRRVDAASATDQQKIEAFLELSESRAK